MSNTKKMSGIIYHPFFYFISSKGVNSGSSGISSNNSGSLSTLNRNNLLRLPSHPFLISFSISISNAISKPRSCIHHFLLQ
jgi:hypothetical protein